MCAVIDGHIRNMYLMSTLPVHDYLITPVTPHGRA